MEAIGNGLSVQCFTSGLNGAFSFIIDCISSVSLLKSYIELAKERALSLLLIQSRLQGFI